MATFTAPPFSPDSVAAILKVSREEAADLLRRRNAYLQKQESVHGKGKPVQKGAPFWTYPVEVREHSTPTRHLTGYEVRNISVVDTDDVMTFAPAYVSQPAALSLVEKTEMQNSEKIDLMKKRQRNVMANMMRDLNRRILTGESVAAGVYDGFNHLEGVNATTGYLEENAFGAQTNSVGGLSKATYAAVLGMQNQAQNALNSASTNALTMLFRLLDDVAVVSGDKTALCIYVSQSLNQHLHRIVQPQDRYVKLDDRDPGMPVKVFGGTDMVVESRMPTGTGHATPISAYILDHNSIKLVYTPNGYFDELPEVQLSKQLVWERPLFLAGQLVVEDGVGTSGVLVNAETY